MDFHALSSQLVRSLRGKRSQRALSRRLQFTTNIVYLWESGRRHPPAHTFFWIVHRVGLGPDLRGFDLPERERDLWDASVIGDLMMRWRSDRTALEIAEAMGVSRHVVGRWLRGTTVPKLPQFLEFLDVCTTQVLDFVALFAEPSGIPVAAESWERLQAARALTHQSLWAPPVLLCLELERYRALPEHSDSWIALQLGIAPSDVEECMALLAIAGQVVRNGPHWRRVEVMAVDTRRSADPFALPRHWGHVAADRIGPDAVASLAIGVVSEADYRRMQEAQRSHYFAMRALIAASAPAERLVLLNFQTLALDNPRS